MYRMYCDHCYHNGCLETYTKTPPFTGKCQSQLNTVEPPNGHTWDPAFLFFVERLSSWRLFCIECIYKGTFRLSFVERFVLLFQRVLYWRYLRFMYSDHGLVLLCVGGKKCLACNQRLSHDKWNVRPKLAEDRWAHQEARKREIAEVADFLGV